MFRLFAHERVYEITKNENTVRFNNCIDIVVRFLCTGNGSDYGQANLNFINQQNLNQTNLFIDLATYKSRVISDSTRQHLVRLIYVLVTNSPVKFTGIEMLRLEQLIYNRLK